MGYLFAAYTIIWALIFIYVITLSKRQADIAKELDIVSEQLQMLEGNKK